MPPPAPLGSGSRFAALKKKAKPAAPADTPDPAMPPGKRRKLPPGAMQAIARGRTAAPPAK